jgi:endonuclease III
LENKKKAAKIVKNLLEKFIPHPSIPLDFTTPFQLLIATILSSQCSDKRVNTVTPKLFQICPSPFEMAKISLKRLSSIISPCGIASRKAISLQKTSQILVEQYNGTVPGSFEELEELPGVGHKTASCIMSHIFHKPAFPVDRHIFRVARRWGLSNGKSVEIVEEDIKKLYPKRLWGRLHLQMVLYARTFCTAQRHTFSLCPICRALTSTDHKANKNESKAPSS